MGEGTEPAILGEGKYLRLIRRDGWEFVVRTKPIRSIFIAAVTDDRKLLLTLEYRVPLGRTAVGLPAGLVGDVEGREGEAREDAARRELVEETGYETRSVSFLSEGPTSPGMTDEVIGLMLATGLHRVGAAGGIDGERIAVHEVPLGEVDAWLRARVAEGALVDPKVYACLYLMALQGDSSHRHGG